MELTKQVASLELSKKLKELGVKQESIFVWVKQNHVLLSNPPQDCWELEPTLYGSKHYLRCKGYCSAFTVAELGEILPDRLDDKEKDMKYQGRWVNGLDTRKQPAIWEVSYMDYGLQYPIYCVISETEADARAKMFIYLLENGLLDRKSE